MGKTKRPRTGREADRAFNQPPFTVRNGGRHKKVYVAGRMVCCYNVHSGELSPGMQAHIAKALLAAVAALLAAVAALIGVML